MKARRRIRVPFSRSKKGALTVEAAIFLPLVILSVLTVAYLLKLIAAQENVFHALADEARSLAANAALTPYPLFFEHDLLARLADENGDEIENTRLSAFRYRFDAAGYSEQIHVTADYEIGVKLPAALIRSIPASDTLLCRAFVGAVSTGDPLPPSALAEEKESRTVWIFPRAGARYHGADCSYIVVHPKEVTLDDSVRRRYDPCKLCDPKGLGNGSPVYCFDRSGEVYHRGSCSSVDRYVIPIEKDEAEARGYTPCAKCGGA
jgi:hypothetical protein